MWGPLKKKKIRTLLFYSQVLFLHSNRPKKLKWAFQNLAYKGARKKNNRIMQFSWEEKNNRVGLDIMQPIKKNKQNCNPLHSHHKKMYVPPIKYKNHITLALIWPGEIRAPLYPHPKSTIKANRLKFFLTFFNTIILLVWQVITLVIIFFLSREKNVKNRKEIQTQFNKEG